MNERHETDQMSTADFVDRPRNDDESTSYDDQGEMAVSERPASPSQVSDSHEPLFASDETQSLRSRWDDIQTGFVDEPRHAVEEADSLVAEIMQRLATVFADERSSLEQQWGRGDDVSTEDLRVALRRYRSFFDRLLSV